ncbi:MAG: cobS [Alphaproteobacteria bacterium]|nr:cobS [Alphaproteobacteria bacterium]
MDWLLAGKGGALSYNKAQMQSPADDTAAATAAALEPAPWLQAFAVALAFFTRLKLRPEKIHPLAACAQGFAAAGAVVGLIVGLVLLAAHGLGLPGLVSALLALGSGLIVTGALHEDGLADCADALGARERERSLAIMRDSRTGTYGVLALLLSTGLRVAALVALPGSVALAALIGAHAFSRGALAIALERLEPLRRDGLGATAGKPQHRQAMLSLGIGAGVLLVVCLLFAKIGVGLFALVLGGLAGMAAMEVARRRFGGQTGDVLGAIQQCIEIAALVAFTFFY